MGRGGGEVVALAFTISPSFGKYGTVEKFQAGLVLLYFFVT